MIRKLLAACTIALAMIFTMAAPAQAAKPPKPVTTATSATLTFDADGSALPVGWAAAEWSKNTGITVVTGECTTGKLCAHFKIVPGLACGQADGCAYTLSDGACQVEVSAIRIAGANKEWMDELITTHEGGHCIFRAGGASGHLPDSPHALMSAVQPSYPSRSDARLTSYDRAFVQTLSF